MNPEPSIHIPEHELIEDRFHSLRLIQWWDQEKIARTKVLVVGAGALGNEILKNLALLGFQQILVVDLDKIELSNLTRTILYRSSDIGRDKASTAAAATNKIYSDAKVHSLHANIIHEVGLGVFGWADLIFGGLDNREARLWINRCAWKMNRPWIDGAIEGINGIARVFMPGSPPCYECTLGETDWAILDKRMSCNLLTREEIISGKTPTTPTVSSIIAGIQVQEGLKLLHGQSTLAGKGFIFEGLNHNSYVTEYTESKDCLSHEVYKSVLPLNLSSSETTPNILLTLAREKLCTQQVQLEFSRDIIHKLTCVKCGTEEEMFVPVGTISEKQGRCKNDGDLRKVVTAHSYDGSQNFGNKSMSNIGLPDYDIVTARTMDAELAMLLAGDAQTVLGPLINKQP